jgi:hypothetical protein
MTPNKLIFKIVFGVILLGLAIAGGIVAWKKWGPKKKA